MTTTTVETSVKERGILFTGPNVLAILEDRKTQTRRRILEVPSGIHCGRPIMDWPLSGIYEDPKGTFWMDVQTDVDDSSHREIYCRQGKPGDRLWVRETWQSGDVAMNEPRGTVYRATDPDWESTEGWKWKPSIFMPRLASRITLEITEIRVEHLQDISEKDAKAEGCQMPDLYSGNTPYRYAYHVLWDSINPQPDKCWAANPYVWAITFRKL